MATKYTINLNKVCMDDLLLVGGKNASLGEMIQNLEVRGIKIPGGFAVTSDAYLAFLKHNDLEKVIKKLISSIEEDNVVSLRKLGTEVRQLIRNAKFPRKLKEEIRFNSLVL